MSALAVRFAEKFASLCAERAEATAMIHPSHLRSDAKEDLKLCAPSRALEGEPSPLEIAQPVGMEIDVPCFIAQDAITSFFENGIVRTPVEQTIVGCPHQLRDHEHLQLKVQTESPAREPKKRMRPMSLDGSTAKVMHQLFKQTGVCLFFGDEEFERLMVSGIVGRLLPCLREEKISLATFAELKMR